MSESTSEGPALQQIVQEVQGWFPTNDALQAAIEKLTLAGHDRADFNMPEEQVFESQASLNESGDKPAGGVDKQQLRTLTTGMAGYAGAVVAAGAAIATGVGAPLAVGAAAAAGAGAAAVSEGTGQAADQAQIDERNRRGATGTLLLAVHVTDEAKANQAAQIMRENGASQTKFITRTDEALTAGISASSWTG